MRGLYYLKEAYVSTIHGANAQLVCLFLVVLFLIGKDCA